MIQTQSFALCGHCPTNLRCLKKPQIIVYVRKKLRYQSTTHHSDAGQGVRSANRSLKVSLRVCGCLQMQTKGVLLQSESAQYSPAAHKPRTLHSDSPPPLEHHRTLRSSPPQSFLSQCGTLGIPAGHSHHCRAHVCFCHHLASSGHSLRPQAEEGTAPTGKACL